MIPPVVPSLLHIAAVKVAVSLYNKKDIQDMVREMDKKITYDTPPFDRNSPEGWEKIRQTANEKIQDAIPTTLQNQVVFLLRAIHEEFKSWLNDHIYVHIFMRDYSYKATIHWASNGKINRIQTAKILVRNRSIFYYGRFLLACTYFLEEAILGLWNGIVSRKIDQINLIEYQNLTTRFWVKWLKEGATTPWSQMVVGYFKEAKSWPRDSPIRLSSFFHILQNENRPKYFKFLDSKFSHDDDLHWCLNHMNEEERVELLTKDSEGYPYSVLRSLMAWPFQNEFLPTAHLLWPYLNPDSFYGVLYVLVFAYVLRDFKYFDYFSLLKKFWRASPVSLRGNKHKKLVHFVKKVLRGDKESSSMTFQDIKREYHYFTPTSPFYQLEKHRLPKGSWGMPFLEMIKNSNNIFPHMKP